MSTELIIAIILGTISVILIIIPTVYYIKYLIKGDF